MPWCREPACARDDEPITAEEAEAIREAYEDIAAGRMQTLEDVEKEPEF